MPSEPNATYRSGMSIIVTKNNITGIAMRCINQVMLCMYTN